MGSVLKIKTLKHCENLFNKIKQYVKKLLLDLINDFEQVFPM